ncbi:outer membrane beta-barrel protein [Pedobacter nyackensis]|uniref:CarboxypepD_reg-like domain-containing protein n=1 Tax=Pedobacter nyackensis TaxID=475255 RepID=A0A1W2CPM2_9SPHI|nr:outer membrane beta-barrel protein [Pedobacter nyackensis]SMC87141.1 CarboxypepD_reg-like domain-containing protein [Pedobacter nyackensis]
MLNSKTKGTIFLLVLIGLLFNQQLNAQTKRVVSGVVKDSTDLGIPSAHIRLIAGKDTINTSSDSDGKFLLSGIRQTGFDILVRGIGYKSHAGKYTFTDKQTEFELGGIVLKPDVQMLDEVVISGKVSPIRVMKDTIEYNTGAYVVREDDRVEDLLKQLPGMEVDEEGKVTSMGKELTKIRVNGKDFFTGNVKEFIKQLPAEMLSHIQVIDDYGDEANFTGIKTGEPRKVLNLVTKPERNRGRFGNFGSNAGTNNRYGFNATGNLWNGDRQTGMNTSVSNSNNSAGMSQSILAGGSIRQPLNKQLSISGGYNFNQNRNENEMESAVETINEIGTIYNDNNSKSNQKSAGNSVNIDVNGRLKDDFFHASVGGNLTSDKSVRKSNSIQTGAIRQDQLNESGSSNDNPGLSTSFNWGKRLGKKKKRTVMINAGANINSTNGDEHIFTQTGYYDKEADVLVKDSLLNRLVDTRNKTNSFNAGFSFSEPISKATDTVKRESIDLSYALSLNSTNNSLQTSVLDVQGRTNHVDSLSNIYTSQFLSHNLRLSYRYNSKAYDYSFGLSMQPSTLTGSYEGRADKVNQTTVNMSPTADARFLLSKSQSLNLNYNGYTTAPRFEQLQPVPDSRNLLNVIIGNPNLKTSFNHSVNIGYRLFGNTSGRALQIGLNGNVVQNQVVSNVSLIPDTLGGFKQETRFENANGNYNFGSNYSLSLPFAERKYNLSFEGNLGYSNAVVYADNAKNYNRGINFSQSLRASLNTKKVSMGTSVNYSFNANDYSLATANSRDIETWSFNLNSRIIASKYLSGQVNASKRINNGYSINSTNPLLIGATIETTFLKNRMASLSLQASDLLNQGNTVNRIITNNSIIDSRSNQVTRYVVMNFSMRLQNFGGKKKS